jgi:hypothetical protein
MNDGLPEAFGGTHVQHVEKREIDCFWVVDPFDAGRHTM